MAVAISTGMAGITAETVGRAQSATAMFAIVAIGLLRCRHTGRSLAPSTLALDAIGMAVLVAGTGGLASAALPSLVAGIHWSASQSPRAGATYALVGIPGWIAAASAGTVGGASISELAGTAVAMLAVALVTTQVMSARREAAGLRSLLVEPVLGGAQEQVRRDLVHRAAQLRPPVDVILEAGQAAPNAVQAEILWYLLSSQPEDRS